MTEAVRDAALLFRVTDLQPTRGYVALLDVLGFSALMAGDDWNPRLPRYLERVREILSPDGREPVVEYVVFSDSIVLTTTESEEALKELLRRGSMLFGALLEEGIALRGAIAFGPYFRSDTPPGVFVAGRPVIEAYKREKDQNWVGITLAPSVLRLMPELATKCRIPSGNWREVSEQMQKPLDWAALVQTCHQIPFHTKNPLGAESYDGFAVVPTDGNSDPALLRQYLDATVSTLGRLKLIAPDPAAQARYNIPIIWLSSIRDLWGYLASQVEAAAPSQDSSP